MNHIIKIGISLFCLGPLRPTGTADAAKKAVAAPEYRKAVDFLFFECLLRHRSADSPGTASGGGVQYVFERTSTGWRLYLFNGSGEPLEAEVDLDLDKVKLLTSIRDMVDGQRFSAAYVFGLPYLFKVPVEAGKYRILRITAEPFEPDYEKYYAF